MPESAAFDLARTAAMTTALPALATAPLAPGVRLGADDPTRKTHPPATRSTGPATGRTVAVFVGRAL